MKSKVIEVKDCNNLEVYINNYISGLDKSIVDNIITVNTTAVLDKVFVIIYYKA